MVQVTGNKRFYNFIWILVLAAVLVVSMFGGQKLDAVALEQEARCGQVEHIHTQDCYMDAILLCDLKAHTHSENCYLLRLEDNDINWLLLTVDRSQDKNLESVLDSEMVQTLVLNENLQASVPTAESAQTQPTTAPATKATTAATTVPTTVSATTEAPTKATTAPVTEPTETTVSTEPTTVPTVPTVPEETTAPTEPTVPEETTAPTVPEETTTPTEPTVPEETTTPTEPTVPEETTTPTEPTVPEETTTPTEPTVPEETTTPTEPTVPEEPTTPTEPTVPEETTTPTEPTAPEETTTPTEPTVPEETTTPTEPTVPEETTTPTEPTVPEETTTPTEPTVPEETVRQASLYIYLNDEWNCIDVLNMQQEEDGTYTLSLATIKDAFCRQLVLDDTIWDADPMHYSNQSPTEGIEEFNPIEEDTLNFGTDAQNQHICLMLEEEAEDGTRYFEPIRFYTVVLNYAPPAERMTFKAAPAEQGAVQARYVQSGQTFDLPADYVWTDAEGNAMTSLTVTQPTAVYAVAPAAETSPKIGGTPSTNRYAINFYIQLDNQPVLVSIGTTSSYYYCDYEPAVKAYADYVRTDLTTDKINKPPKYYFVYNYTGPTDSLTNATYPDSRIRFGSTYSTRYVFLASGAWSDAANGWVYTPIDFYTVTLDYSAVGGQNQEQYVESGLASTLTLSPEYQWAKADGTPATQEDLQNITGTTTLYAKLAGPAKITVSFEGADEIQPIQLEPGEDGTVTVTLPSLADTEYSDRIWVEKGNDDGTSYPSDGTAEVTLNKDTTFVAIPAECIITFKNTDGSVIGTVSVPYGQALNFREDAPDLPAGCIWTGEDGTIYEATAIIDPILQDMTITAEEKSLLLTYNVNFPTYNNLYNAGFTLTTGKEAPTLLGDASVTVTAGSRTTIQNVSEQNVELTPSAYPDRNAIAHFQGWTTADGTLITPDSRPDYTALLAMDTDGDGVVKLTGKWIYRNEQSVNFFVRYNAGVNSDSNSQENYTDVVFTTYVGGLENMYSWSFGPFIYGKTKGTDYNAAEFYEYDKYIRSLYGEKDTGVWLPEFPDDATMLEILKTANPDETLYAQLAGASDNRLEPVDRDELNTSNYTIRWYMFNWIETWHIDGLLVKKQGQITVDKEFNGDTAAIEAAENGNFYITAQNGTMENGVFTPYTNEKARNLTLYLDDATKSGDHSYKWVIDEVSLGEYWKVEEHAETVTVNGKEYIYYTEYSIYDSDGNITEVAEYGTKAHVIGKTYALDEDPTQGMSVEFKNYYYPVDTLLIKKEDADTGKPLSGAAFELWQYNTNGIPVQLKFSYDDETGQYKFDSNNGTITAISTGATGYTNVALTDFSYEHGTVILKEVTAPAGYDPAPWIEISERDGQVVLSNVYHEGQDAIDPSEWYQHAEVNEDGYVLVVKDHNAEFVTVNVDKVWDPVDVAQESITVVLQANGTRATNVFPSLQNVEVVIDAQDNWHHSWTNLPAFANGVPVQWSVKEIAIGDEKILSNNSSFANWISTVVLTSRRDTDDSGLDDEWNYLVTNTPRRTQIILTKTDESGKALPEAGFTLEEVEYKNGAWQRVANGLQTYERTNENGILTFDDLTAGAFYRLSEVRVPSGHISLLDPVVLTVNGEGLIKSVDDDGRTLLELEGPILSHTGAYNIRVVNQSGEPLPETGGMGTHIYTQSGLLLVSAGMALLIYQKRKRCRRGVSPDA